LITTPQPAILLRPEPRHERRQWAVAHELGELWAERVFDQLDIDPRAAESGLREAVANQLACRLLLPTEWFHPAALHADWDLTALKRKFDTASHELIARRMLDFNDPAMLITVVDLGRVSFRACNQRGFRPALTAAEARCQSATHRRGVGTKFQDAQWSIRCWAIHEPGWKREIICAQWKTVDWD
jgi:predicted transcriptional regulator